MPEETHSFKTQTLLPARWQTAWKIVMLLLLALIIGRFLVLGTHKVLINHQSSDGDESAYLALGLAVKESGTLSDGTRPPLYPAILALFAEREWAYFTTAKEVTLLLSALAIIATFAVGVQMFGWETALLAAFLLAINKEFHSRAVTIYADNLLLLIMLGCWYFLIKSLTGWKSCLLAGLFVGLAFLTKGSAPLLLAAWGLTALIHYRLKIFRHFELGLVPLAFILTALPLLIYNANTFGSPTYNFATHHIMWMDELAQINTADPADLPTASTYFATHTTADMAARIEKGVRRLHPRITETILPQRSFNPPWLGPLTGILALGSLLFLLRYRRQALSDYLGRHKNTLWLSFFMFSFFYLSLVWYVAGSSAETRFIIPFLGPVYLLLADMVISLARGLGRWLHSLGSNRKTPVVGKYGGLKFYWLGLALLIGWGVWWHVETALNEAWALEIDPYEADRSANAEVEQIVQWFAVDNPTGEALIAFGPSKSLPIWKFPAGFTLERLPYEITTWTAMQNYIREQRPDYIIIDDDTARRRREALSGHFQRRNGQVIFEQIPAGWSLEFVYPGIPCQWCVFSPAPPAATLPIATLENGIELLDWRTGQAGHDEAALAIPAEQSELRVILTWRAKAPPPQDYTVFVHLTALDGFVKAQHDQPPFDSAYPTSRWQAGEVLSDRYMLHLDGSITPGDYLLLAGMYEPESGKRLSVLDGPTGPTSDTVLLGPIQVNP
jgi:4-amino-4-deoxy-L-arabinose transferase-like glycosyltransferase